MSSPRLTEGTYWDQGYATGELTPLRYHDYRHLGDRRIVDAIAGVVLAGARVLEIGAGNSAVLTHLATNAPAGATFAGLDYSPRGCAMLAARAERAGVAIRVYQQDLFAAPPELAAQFDVVFSLGVVEHFTSLADVLRAQAAYLAPGGRMFTLIPNMVGVIGKFTRRYNRTVYDLHVAHDLDSFVAGHREAGLTPEQAGYLCSTNFGVLSSCFPSGRGPGWSIYKWLSRVTKSLWFLESRFGDLRGTRALSPYLIVVSRR
jgi:2-polyprenyl-3-methyl-5-hydroxy-6-metoxy-1,4-benzoquinol methylase